MKRFKYRALVKLDSAGSGAVASPLPATGGRVVVLAHHHETHQDKMFGALVDAVHGEPLHPANHSIQLTVTVTGDDAATISSPATRSCSGAGTTSAGASSPGGCSSGRTRHKPAGRRRKRHRAMTFKAPDCW